MTIVGFPPILNPPNPEGIAEDFNPENVSEDRLNTRGGADDPNHEGVP
jgi:hypothetical protein